MDRERSIDSGQKTVQKKKEEEVFVLSYTPERNAGVQCRLVDSSYFIIMSHLVIILIIIMTIVKGYQARHLELSPKRFTMSAYNVS